MTSGNQQGGPAPRSREAARLYKALHSKHEGTGERESDVLDAMNEFTVRKVEDAMGRRRMVRSAARYFCDSGLLVVMAEGTLIADMRSNSLLEWAEVVPSEEGSTYFDSEGRQVARIFQAEQTIYIERSPGQPEPLRGFQELMNQAAELTLWAVADVQSAPADSQIA